MSRFCTISLLLGAICMSGCQQPAASGGRQPFAGFSQQPRLFDFGRPAYAQGGTNNGIVGQPPNNFAGPQQQQFSNLSQQVQSLNSQLGRFDSDNQQLFTEMAALKQKLQVANDYNYQLKQQLADSVSQMQQLNQDKLSAEQQLANFRLQGQQSDTFRQASSGGAGFGGATLRANNSLMRKLPQIQIPGAQARMDGDVIRIEIPTDQLFTPGTYQVNAAHAHLLQNLATSIRQNFSGQIIGIEAHWDGTPIQPATTTHHQLTASQSLAVFDYLTRLGLPGKQMFAMAMGSNRPRHNQGAGAGGISPNRRVEVVIYPETYEGSN